MINPLWSYIFGPPKDRRTLLELLKTLPVFDGLTERDLIQVCRNLHLRNYRADELVFKEGEPGAGMYIIKSGEVIITKKLTADNEVQLAVIKEGNFFGELALLDETPRTASAHPSRDTVLLGFCKPDLDNIFERNPRLGIAILNNISRLVCRRLVAANELIRIQGEKLHAAGLSQGESK